MRALLFFCGFQAGADDAGLDAGASVVLLPDGGVPEVWLVRHFVPGGGGLRAAAAADLHREHQDEVHPEGFRDDAHGRCLDGGPESADCDYERAPARLQEERHQEQLLQVVLSVL